MINRASLSTRMLGCGNVRRYTARDLELIQSWYLKRGINPPDPASLSDMGFIIDGRVAGWIYLTNSNIAMIEGVISDPDTIPSYRRESLNKLCAFLVDTALMLGYTQILGLTTHRSIDKICKHLGFKRQEHTLWVLAEDPEEDQIGYQEDDYE